MKKNPTLLIIAFVMLINSLSYGIIIPLMYPFSQRFGINAFGLSVMFASFSVAQLISTPIIGRLSDKYGRKPLLMICLFGSSLALAMMAGAQNAGMLFASRFIDGITGGNNSVAQAAIADSTKGKDRAQAFGLLGAAFGFGFLFGPALGGLLSTISLSAPFWFASALAFVGTIAGVIMMKETLPKGERQPKKEVYFNLSHLVSSFTNPLTGVILAITFIYTLAFNAWIIGFQSFTNDILHLSVRDIGLLFASFGVISIIMQSVGIKFIMEKFKNKDMIVTVSLLLTTLFVAPLYFVHSFIPFFVIITIYGIVSSPIMAVTTALISERTKAEDQGGILGINQAVMSFGQIVGPLIAGAVAVRSVNMVFLVTAGIMFVAVLSTKKLHATSKVKVDL